MSVFSSTVIVGPIFTPDTKRVTYFTRTAPVSCNFEPYQGFNTFMHALPRILEEQKDGQRAWLAMEGQRWLALTQRRMA